MMNKLGSELAHDLETNNQVRFNEMAWFSSDIASHM